MRSRFWLVALAVVVCDQITKLLVEFMLPAYRPVPVLPGIVSLTRVYNTGVAFGQFRGAGPLLVITAAVAVIGIILYRVRLLRTGGPIHPLLALGLALPLGGAVGNMLDRIRIGQVVDFVDFGWFPVFNVADMAITLGAVSLIAYFLFAAHPEEPEGEKSVGQLAG